VTVRAPHAATAADIDPMPRRPDANGKGLLDHHRKELHASGISDELIAKAGIYSEASYNDLSAIVGWKSIDRKAAPAIVFPHFKPDGSRSGYHTIKPAVPIKRGDRESKYLAPSKQPPQPYFPPGTQAVLTEPTAELLITEGQKKALAADQHGFHCIGLLGVWNWKSGSAEELLPELRSVAWKGRNVRIAFDSDAVDKKPVRDAETRLAAGLTALGAIVKVVRLPGGPAQQDGSREKVGLDDFLVAHGPAALRKLLDAAVDPDDVDPIEMKADARDMDPASEAEKLLHNTERDGSPRLIFHRGAFHWWRHGCYSEQQTTEVRASVTRHANAGYRHVTTGTTSNLLDQVRAASLVPGYVEPNTWLGNPPLMCNTPFPTADLLVTRKQIIHLPSFVGAREHAVKNTPAFYATAALPFELDPNAPPPTLWLQFLDQVLPDDPQSQELIAQWFGYCLTRSTAKQKILFLKGATRSGKGVILRVLRALVGEHNAAGPTLSSLTTNFGLWALLGKSVATISDARLSGRVDQAIITERLLSISGEDTLTIDRKNLEPVTAKLDCRIVIASNELPKLNDASGALVGRLLVIPFTESFLGREDDGLTTRLLSELPSILLWAIGGWKRLQEVGRFVQSDSALEELNDLADLSSPVRAFVKDCCEVGPGHETPIPDLFAAWKVWCEKKNREHPGTEQVFGRDLGAAMPGLKRGSRRDGTDRWRVYVGIGLRGRPRPL